MRDSATASGNRMLWSRFTAADFTLVAEDGRFFDKQTAAESVVGETATLLQPSEESAIRYGAIYLRRITTRGARRLEVWGNSSGTWQVVAAQHTRLGGRDYIRLEVF